MLKLLGAIAVLLSLGCFVTVANFIRVLSAEGWSRVGSKAASIPMDTAIGVGILLAGLALLGVGVSLLDSQRRPPV
jgi:hypothetical protein